MNVMESFVLDQLQSTYLLLLKEGFPFAPAISANNESLGLGAGLNLGSFALLVPFIILSYKYNVLCFIHYVLYIDQLIVFII